MLLQSGKQIKLIIINVNMFIFEFISLTYHNETLSSLTQGLTVMCHSWVAKFINLHGHFGESYFFLCNAEMCFKLS